MKTKICTKCKVPKTLDEFYFRKDLGKYRNECKICFAEKTKELKYIKFPWRKHFYSARRRCTNPKASDYHRYGGRGIKFLLTMEDIKELWFRDKAYSMKKPSIDREDSDGNYEVDNCQFMELRDNIAKINHYTVQILQFDKNNNFIKEWKSITEASFYNTNKASSIKNCLRGASKSSGGYIWRYKNGES